jgi:hypothetical protein
LEGLQVIPRCFPGRRHSPGSVQWQRDAAGGPFADLAFHRDRTAKKSGQDAYQEILRFQPGVRVLYSSGYSADFLKIREAAEDEMEVVAKPVRPWELLRKVREVLDR